MEAKDVKSLQEAYASMYNTSEEATNLQESVETVEEGIMGALKKVGKAILGPADQSPEAEAARMGKRRGPGAPNKAPMKGDTPGTPMKKADTPNNSGGSGGTAKGAPAPNMKEDADVFDIVKDYLMTEHDATEEEALKVMLELTDEERTSIVEGIIGQTADNIARTVGTAIGTGERVVRELPGYLKQKAKNVKSTFDSARERASSNNPDVRSGRMVSNRPAKKTSPANKETSPANKKAPYAKPYEKGGPRLPGRDM